METVPGRQKEENLSNQSTVNKVHFIYPQQKTSKKSQSKDYPLPPLGKKIILVLSLTFP